MARTIPEGREPRRFRLRLTASTGRDVLALIRLSAIGPIGLLSLALLAAGRDSGARAGVGLNAVFARDHNGAGVPEVGVYLDFDTTPLAATDTRGWLDLYLGGMHSLHFAKPGYATCSYVDVHTTSRGGWSSVPSRRSR